MTNSNRQTYYIYDRIGPRVEFIPNDSDNKRPSGQRGWLMHHRSSNEGGTSDGDDD